MYTKLTALSAILLLSGCASIFNGTSQKVKVETVTADGQVIEGVDCELRNAKRLYAVKSGESVKVSRSKHDLAVSCAHAEQPGATGRMISRVNAGILGDVALTSPLALIIDFSNGAAYSYPGWIRLVFGEHRVYDRNVPKKTEWHEGTPEVIVSETVSTQVAPAKTSSPTATKQVEILESVQVVPVVTEEEAVTE